MSQGPVQILGYSSYQKPTSWSVLFLVFVIDLSFILSLNFMFLDLLQISPIPNFQTIFLFGALTCAYWITSKIVYRTSLGSVVWGLKPKGGKSKFSWFETLYQPNRVELPQRFFQWGATCFIPLLMLLSVEHCILNNPLWLPGNSAVWEPWIPSEKNWQVIPFFYTIAAWPKEFEGKTVFYSIPYEKGPPSQFAGRIVANWANPDVKMTFEGPKTPLSAGNRESIKTCFTGEFSFHCMDVKNKTLNRHLREIRSLSPRKWSIQWFHVNQPYLNSIEQTQGIYIKAENQFRIQDRFILITPQGTHQTLILNRLKDAQGAAAFEYLQKTIRSLQSFDELTPGRVWVNRELGNIHLNDELTGSQGQPSLRAAKLAEIQALLISKISVDPSSLDSYFHLAGTSVLLKQNISDPSSTWNIAALQNLKSSFRFASDIDPSNQKTQQIQGLIFEIEKKH